MARRNAHNITGAPPFPAGLFVAVSPAMQAQTAVAGTPTVAEMDDDHPPQGDDAPMRARSESGYRPGRGRRQAAVTRVTADRQG